MTTLEIEKNDSDMYYHKYLKYKIKYLELKEQYGNGKKYKFNLIHDYYSNFILKNNTYKEDFIKEFNLYKSMDRKDYVKKIMDERNKKKESGVIIIYPHKAKNLSLDDLITLTSPVPYTKKKEEIKKRPYSRNIFNEEQLYNLYLDPEKIGQLKKTPRSDPQKILFSKYYMQSIYPMRQNLINKTSSKEKSQETKSEPESEPESQPESQPESESKKSKSDSESKKSKSDSESKKSKSNSESKKSKSDS